jgi:hypothetical protein
LKGRANKKAASVSEGRFAFAGIDFICPESRAGVGGVGGVPLWPPPASTMMRAVSTLR